MLGNISASTGFDNTLTAFQDTTKPKKDTIPVVKDSASLKAGDTTRQKQIRLR